MYLKKILAVAMTVCVVFCVSACSLLPEEEVFKTTALVKEYDGDEFNMTTVKRGDIKDYRNIPCTFNQSNIDEVKLPAWLTIKKVCVKAGDKVKAGDILVELETDEALSDADEIKYEIKKMKATIRQARNMCELEVARQKIMLDDETVIKAIRENYDAQISSYEGELNVLKTQYSEALKELDQYRIKSSISGTVTYADASKVGQRKMNIGGANSRFDWNEEFTVVTVSDGGLPFFTADVDSSEYIKELSEGQEIKVTCPEREYVTTVHFPKDDSKKVYFLLDYVPDDIDNGSLANAEYVISERKDVLYLPESSVNKMGDSYIVYYEDDNGLKNAREVTVGLFAENKVEITGGLEFGDAVIVR